MLMINQTVHVQSSAKNSIILFKFRHNFKTVLYQSVSYDEGKTMGWSESVHLPYIYQSKSTVSLSKESDYIFFSILFCSPMGILTNHERGSTPSTIFQLDQPEKLI